MLLRLISILFLAFMISCQPKNVITENVNLSTQNINVQQNIHQDAVVVDVAEVPVADNYSISGPYTYDNLSVFLFHGEDKIKTDKIITLEEALKENKIKVYETGEVNELAVENLSSDYAVYIHVGDIVKGGKQDRAIGKDLLVMPGTGKMPIDSFCVESGRWESRGDESVAEFSSNQELAGKSLKVALKYKKNQQAVWNKVSDIQGNLSSNIGANVTSTDSATSMQLTLENKNVRLERAKYIDALENIVHQTKDCLGFAYTVNGKVVQTDIYGSRRIFVKLWPKLLKAATIEALQKKSEESFEKPSKDVVSSWIDKMRAGEIKKQKLSKSSTEYVYSNDESMGEDVWVEGDSLFGGDSNDYVMLHSSFSDISDESFTEKEEYSQEYLHEGNVDIYENNIDVYDEEIDHSEQSLFDEDN